jgi:demethylmenaquinone methyltransferase / 2-methoxy-6-polyprenyl-1,4-benzoquinol methylase
VTVDRREAPSPRRAHAERLFDAVAARYDGPAAAFGLGQYGRWRAEMVRRLSVPRGARILDVATGTGLVARELADRYSAGVVGLDQSAEMLRTAKAASPRVTFVRGDGQRLPFADGAFDAVTHTYLLRYVDDPAATLIELARVLRPGGRMASVEFAVPANAAVRWAWKVYGFALFPFFARTVSPGWHEVGEFLASSIATFDGAYPPERIAELWRAAGLRDVGMKRMSLGGGVVTWGRRDA